MISIQAGTIAFDKLAVPKVLNLSL